MCKFLKVKPDEHGLVCTLTRGMRQKDTGESILPYKLKNVMERKLWVKQQALITPVEDGRQG